MNYEKLNDIWKRHGALQRERREAERTLMEEYDKAHYEKVRALQDECEKETGHNMKFSNFGPLGHSWFHCTGCGKSKVEGEQL